MSDFMNVSEATSDSIQVELAAATQKIFNLRSGNDFVRAILVDGGSPSDTLINGMTIIDTEFIRIPHNGKLILETTTAAIINLKIN